MADDIKFMTLALECAARGRGEVEPNPMVGAVVVRDGVELARGWHKKFGGPHAEIEALSAARAAGINPAGATMYVTLEPCCHQGKTPPCTAALIDAKLARVVAAMVDPDPKVSGQGIAALKKAGIVTEVGVMQDQARQLLAAYVKHRTTGRPWVICKWAQTTDGYMAMPPGGGRWISSRASRDRVHQIRAWCDGVVVGIGTLLADNPHLGNRSGKGGQPARIVLDSSLRTPIECQLAATTDRAKLIIVTAPGAAAAKPLVAQRLRSRGAEIIELPAAEKGLDLGALLDELGRRGWISVLIEGGSAVLTSVLEQKLADEVIVFVGPQKVAAPAATLPRLDIAQLQNALPLTCLGETAVDIDRMLRFQFRH
ncbi:MAG: bifunctional diaminohydroxyphosphoribosylaminopyrimidine deaminase/5-amino-6-(5-phosphoribosylamino)uracil reductase RibD [Planctomycetaceae bacterium]|nr:bifunctional diaminohydroxyphosphoribosylaminopyrimidine deaminase/5-amino-6-(5-phosphoribosylamino)uracil reductase RibD [Planctomycetaceae bacterium]